MSTLTRSAKPGSSWTKSDLRAFNIQIVFEDPQAFFGVANLPVPNISPIIWNNVREPQDVPISKIEMDFFGYLKDAMLTPPDEESTINDYIVFLLKMLEFDAGRRLVLTHKEISFLMCGVTVSAKPDAAVIQRSGSTPQWILLVQEDKRHLKRHDPEPQLIAAAIGAFHENNLWRQRSSLPPLSSQTFLGIVMVTTSPEFYKVTITQELLFSIGIGEYPSQPTVVKWLTIPVPDFMAYRSGGMVSLENRRVALECLEALKKLMNDQVGVL